ncbi:hypothetical protein ACS0TY_016539 [Phlomoides rotata]
MILVFLIFFFPALFFFLVHKQTKPSIKYPPGPPGLPFIGNLHQFDTATLHIYLSQLSKKYGALISIKLGSIRLLIVSSADGAKEVLKTHDLTFCSRPKALGQHKLSYNGSDIGFAPYSDSWRELRKICVLHLLSNKQVQSFRPTLEAEVFRMMRELSVNATAGEVINLSRMMLSLTSTLICRVAFGKRVDEEETRRRRFDELMIKSQAMQGPVFVSDYLPWFDDFFEELIDEHTDLSRISSGNPNILDLLIQLKEDNSCSIDLTWDHVKAILKYCGIDQKAITKE